MLSPEGFASRFGRPLIGMVHLAPLPGAPLFAGTMDEVIDAALADARALLDGGCDGMLFENFGDRPFFKERVGPETVAAMTRVIAAVTSAVALPFGVNVLRNDALSALGIAAATGAAFIRVNVHTGAIRALEEHPLPRWLAAGVKACVNTDNTLLSAVDAPTELANAARIPGMTPALLQRAVEHGHAAAFRR